MAGDRHATWITRIGTTPKYLHVRKTLVRAIAGAEQGKSWEVEGERVRFGAQEWNNVVLTDPKVSGLHCQITLSQDGYRIRDHDSTNGTYVGNVRIIEAHLDLPATLRIGDTVLEIKAANESARHDLADDGYFGSLVGGSVSMRKLYAELARVAPSDATVLVRGETGVGKELVAASVHDTSHRSQSPFVILDCGSIPPNLMESELFGHERGAFTGAQSRYVGAFERANGGTLFLDEMQPKLLRVLESRTIRRVGSGETISVDVRIVAATNRDLAVEVNRGKFRSDLYFRLAVIETFVPPLRERKEDIPALIDRFLADLPNGDGCRVFTPAVMEQMKEYDWPGNVRELRNIVERAALLGTYEVNEMNVSAAATDTGPAIDTSVPFKIAKRQLIDDFERRYAERLLQEHDGNVSAAARAAGVDRMSLHKILQRHDLR